MKTANNLYPELRLAFEIQHPALDTVWQDGYSACEQGMEEEANPHMPESKEYQYWQEGWFCACFDEPRPFTVEQTTTVDEHASSVIKLPTPKSTRNTWHRRSLEIMGIVMIGVIGYVALDYVA